MDTKQGAPATGSTTMDDFTFQALNSYEKLAAENASILRDSSFSSFLVFAMDSKNEIIILKCLQIFSRVAQSKESLAIIPHGCADIQKALLALLTRSVSVEIRQLTEDIIRKLCPPSVDPLSREEVMGWAQCENDFNSISARRPESDGTGLEGGIHFIRRAPAAKTLSFRLRHGLTSNERDAVEKSLLSVKGIISIYFPVENRCVVRVKEEVCSDALGSAFLSAGISEIDQILRDQNNIETFVGVGEGERGVEADEERLPEYLNESFGEWSCLSEEGAVAPLGFHTKDSSSGWFSSLTSFISNSFYW